MPKLKPLKIREYARYRNVSHVSVLRAIENGRLHKSVLKRNNEVLIIREIADLEWRYELVNDIPDLGSEYLSDLIMVVINSKLDCI